MKPQLPWLRVFVEGVVIGGRANMGHRDGCWGRDCLATPTPVLTRDYLARTAQENSETQSDERGGASLSRRRACEVSSDRRDPIALAVRVRC